MPMNLNRTLTGKYSSTLIEALMLKMSNVGFVSVEALAMENLVDVQLKPLRESIHALQQASIALMKKSTRLKEISER